MPGKIINRIKEDTLLLVAFILAAATSFIKPPSISYIDFKVLIALFNLMLVVEAFKKLKLLEAISIKILKKFKEERKVASVIIIITFLFSMLVTNDVALITFVPLTLIIAKKADINPTLIIILQTLAANIGSSLTPMGNPQNLYLYYKYSIPLKEFIHIMLPFAGAGLIFLMAMLNLLVPNKTILFNIEEIKIENKEKTIAFILLFLLAVLSILKLISYYLALGTIVAATLFLDRKLFKKVDYNLLLTFIFFFIFIGNLTHFTGIRDIFSHMLGFNKSTFISSIALSQFLSNVPCSILLSGFTHNYQELLLGVNIGGMGTIIASLASVISYKFYVNEYREHKRKYLREFSIYNFASLVIFTIPFWFLLN